MYTKNREAIMEIKRGHTGTGLLIENDGHIVGNNDTIRQIKEDIEHHDKFVIPDKFVVSAVFQKYGIKNANGRIYPEAILKREVEKYINDRVRTRGSIGALDHPSCQLSGTRILTKYGWKLIEDITTEDEVLTLKENKDIEINKVERKIESDYTGKLICLKGRFIDLKVTPNHKFPVFDRHKKWKGFYTAQEILDGLVPDQSHCYLYKQGNWIGENDEFFTIPALTAEEIARIPSNTLKEKYSHELQIPMDVWAKFMGIYLSEGCTDLPDKVSIFQRKESVCDEIREMLTEFPLKYTEYYRNNTSIFVVCDMRLVKYLKQFGICYDKYVPYELKKQNKETLKLFYDWFVMGDGRGRGLNAENYYTDDVFSTSQRLVMDLNEIQLKIGYNGAYHMEERNYDRVIEDRVIKAENSSPMHFTYRSHNQYILLGKMKVTEEDYEGKVYCIECKNHDFYTMGHDGHCLWSGNSTTLSGHDVSHIITNLEWVGQTLIGEMELHLTPGYRRYGIASTSGDLVANMLLDNIHVGVSSRGVGTVEDKFGVMMVGDDYELLCWDVVMEPSSPGAWIGMDRNELQQYVESDQSRNDKPIVTEKIQRIKQILV